MRFKSQKLFTGDVYFTGEHEKQSCDARRVLQEMSIATFQMGNGKKKCIFPTNTSHSKKKKNRKEKKGNINGGSPSEHSVNLLIKPLTAVCLSFWFSLTLVRFSAQTCIQDQGNQITSHSTT